MNVCVFFMGFSAFISSLAFTSCLFLSPFYNYTTENSVITNIPDKQPDKISKIIVWSWNGGSTIKTEQLKETIDAVQSKLSFIPEKNEHYIFLLLETSAAESLNGIFVKQKKGPARGIFQMEPETEKCTLKWLKNNNKEAYAEVMFFYERKKSPDWNRTYNVPYGIALSSAYYWRRLGDDLSNKITTLEDRAVVWKTYYNTHLGKGTVSGYIEKSKKYL